MAAEIKHSHEIIIQEKAVLPGEKIDVHFMDGKKPGVIEVIGTQDGFVVRRPGAQGQDIQYSGDDSLTFLNPDGTKYRIAAKRPQNWIADPMLDPTE